MYSTVIGAIVLFDLDLFQVNMSACPMENVLMPPSDVTAITFEVGSRGATGNDHAAKQSAEKPAVKWGLGELEFEAYMRHLDNAGFRTGYPYRQPAVRAITTRSLSGVELPASASSTLPAEFYDLEISDKCVPTYPFIKSLANCTSTKF